jgi:hypothetical protein
MREECNGTGLYKRVKPGGNSLKSTTNNSKGEVQVLVEIFSE